MGFETDLRSRLTALEVTPATIASAGTLRSDLETLSARALDHYYEIWRSLPGFDEVVRLHGPAIREAQAPYFAALFSRPMDRDYVAHLESLGEVERGTGLGVRIHLGGVTHVLVALFEEVGRRHRWSGPATAKLCADLFKIAALDCMNAIHIDGEHLKKAVTARESAVGEALSTFVGAADRMRSALSHATDTLALTSGQTAGAVDAALESAARTGSAADRGADSLLSTAGASEQLVASIGEVDQLANQSLDAVRQTTASVGSLESELGELERAATAIGSVVTMIAGIANQTNLLALNATIEAARAGEAGRGFSVVAAEVKSLAGQTADATREITSQVSAIQAAASRSASQLGSIVSVIAKVEDISAAAAAATSEQAMATASIAEQAKSASDAVATIRTAVDGMRVLMEELRGALRGLDEASRRLSGHGDMFQQELGLFSERLTAA